MLANLNVVDRLPLKSIVAASIVDNKEANLECGLKFHCIPTAQEYMHMVYLGKCAQKISLHDHAIMPSF